MSSSSKQLRFFDLTIIVISLVIGMGIFRTPSEVAEKAGSVDIFFMAWVAGSIVSMIGALTFAEIGSRYPTTGGFYKIFSVCYSPVFAFMVNWITVISNAASTAAVALMGAAYLSPFLFPKTPDLGTQLIAIGMVVVLTVFNYMGLKVSVRVLNVLMIVKIALVLLIISALFVAISSFASPEITDVSTSAAATGHSPLHGFFLCFIPVFFTYGGYQQTMNFGGDIPNASRNLPRAIITGMLIVTGLYLLVNLSYYMVLGMDGLAKTETLAADMIEYLFGKHASFAISLIMFFAVMTYVNVSILSNPRVYFAMAEDGVMPEIFKRVNPKTDVQIYGVGVFCAIILLTLFFMQSFQKILDYVMFFDSISLITAAAAIFILRKRKVGEDQPIFRLKGYPYLPILYMVVYSGVMVSVFLKDWHAFLIGAGLFLLGYPLFYGLRKVIRG